MRGPPPVPNVVKLLRGNPGKGPIRPEPRPHIPENIPEPPAFLTGYAADEWRRIAPELFRIRLLSVLDVGPLAAYCLAYKRWRDAEDVLATMRDSVTGGVLVKRPDGSVGRNPLVRIASRAPEQMVACGARLPTVLFPEDEPAGHPQGVGRPQRLDIVEDPDA
jgi:P27 family predicted phage terminase small subunit